MKIRIDIHKKSSGWAEPRFLDHGNRFFSNTSHGTQNTTDVLVAIKIECANNSWQFVIIALSIQYSDPISVHAMIVRCEMISKFTQFLFSSTKNSNSSPIRELKANSCEAFA